MTATLTAPAIELDDTPHESGEDRFAIYVARDGRQRRLAETSQDGIGLTLITLRDEDQFTDLDSIGVYDRALRRWVVNPWAKA